MEDDAGVADEDGNGRRECLIHRKFGNGVTHLCQQAGWAREGWEVGFKGMT